MKTLTVLFILMLIAFLTIAKISNGQSKTKSFKIVIPNNEVVIAGTLTKPKRQQAEPLVIMISGSGPQDRDETIYGFKIFGVLSKELSMKWISSFRYDDRGVRKSTGDFAMSGIDDLTKDVETIIAYLQADGYENFILLGHSQGGIIAGKVAARNPAVKGVVLMASPGVPLSEVVLAQLRSAYADSEVDKFLVDAEINAHRLLMSSIEHENVTEDVLLNLEACIFETKLAISNQDEHRVSRTAKNLTRQYQIAYDSPSLASFLFYDPIEDLKMLHVPVLGLYGGKDVQATIRQNRDRMEEALGKANVIYQAVIFDNANHLFQESLTGSVEEYKKLDNAFVDGFSNTVSTWIKGHFK